MKKYKVTLIILLAVLAMLLVVGCDGSDTQQSAKESLAVPAVVATQTAKAETGPTCAYGLAISKDVQHRLNHYRICNSNGNEAKRIKALEKALDDCYELCDNAFESGTDEHVVCVNQCNAE